MTNVVTGMSVEDLCDLHSKLISHVMSDEVVLKLIVKPAGLATTATEFHMEEILSTTVRRQAFVTW
jgi:hypothetical protein